MGVLYHKKCWLHLKVESQFLTNELGKFCNTLNYILLVINGCSKTHKVRVGRKTSLAPARVSHVKYGSYFFSYKWASSLAVRHICTVTSFFTLWALWLFSNFDYYYCCHSAQCNFKNYFIRRNLIIDFLQNLMVRITILFHFGPFSRNLCGFTHKDL